MTNWFAGPGGQDFATAVIWTFAALILLVIVLVVVRLIRGMTFGTFVAGGRNRKTRLAVMDATAVDSHRRLVLVRRDDIEHLLLIGGPTDVVVEREIRMTSGRRTQSVFGSDSEFEAQAESPIPTPLPTVPQAPSRQRAPEPAQRPPLPMRGPPPSPRHAERPPQPVRQPPQPVRQPPRPARPTGSHPPVRDAAPLARANPPRLPPASLPPVPAAISSSGFDSDRQPPSNLDDALLRELEVTFDGDQSMSSFDTGLSKSSFDLDPPKIAPKPVEMTLDDEMTKLLGELSNNKR